MSSSVKNIIGSTLYIFKVKEESEKVGLKLNIQKTKMMAIVPITSWEIDGKQWKQCQALFLGGLQKSLQMVIAAMKLKDTYSHTYGYLIFDKRGKNIQ